MSSEANPTPKPGPPRPAPHLADAEAAVPDVAASALIPDADDLARLPVAEHVAIFEEVQTTLAEQLDDSEG